MKTIEQLQAEKTELQKSIASSVADFLYANPGVGVDISVEMIHQQLEGGRTISFPRVEISVMV